MIPQYYPAFGIRHNINLMRGLALDTTGIKRLMYITIYINFYFFLLFFPLRDLEVEGGSANSVSVGSGVIWVGLISAT